MYLSLLHFMYQVSPLNYVHILHAQEIRLRLRPRYYIWFEKIHPFLDGNGRSRPAVIILDSFSWRIRFSGLVSFEEYLEVIGVNIILLLEKKHRM